MSGPVSPRGSRRTVKALITLILAVLLLSAFSFVALRWHVFSPSSSTLIAPEVAAIAPDFELQSLSGESVTLSSLRGRPVIVNFWATWCAPCILEMPNLEKYYQRYSREFEILAVNAGESEDDVRRFVEKIGVTFPILLDPQIETQALYRVRGLPTTFILNGDGIIEAIHLGLLSEKQLSGYLAAVGVKQ